MSSWRGGKQLIYFLWFPRAGKKSSTVQGYLKVLVLLISLGYRRTRRGRGRKMVGRKRGKERHGRYQGTSWKWTKVCGWVKVGWAGREIAPTLLNTLLPPRPLTPAIGPPSIIPQTLSFQTPGPLLPVSLSVSLFFRSVEHGAEKIIFITCQHLAALSYAMQDSIKLSYTGMKLQNPPGTSQQNYFIFPPPGRKKEKK